ncbi:MAG TPA: hypothetical protein VLF42_00085 [Burkholderiales bacterium]|nr:hypothetical protein [Burkholderiales bacterium]
MTFRVIAGIVAVVLLAGFLVPYVLKLKEYELGIVIGTGIVMMLVDLWQSLKSKED